MIEGTPYTDAEAARAREWVAAHGPRNAWTATYGTAAAMIGRLLDERDRLMGGRQGKTMNHESLEAAVIAWAEARKIIPNSTPMAQLLKTMSELGELADATLKGNESDIVDGVGDVLVTLIIYCRLQGIRSTVGCLEAAYETIKDRRGTLTPEGVFLKEGP